MKMEEIDMQLYNGDCLEVMKTLPIGSIQTIVTSPPYYGLRDYNSEGQIGIEKTAEEYIAKLVDVFREAKRVLQDDGTLWLNMGDSYDSKRKQLMGIPWRVALALQADGWYLRQDIIWNKVNAMPESVKNRCTKSHEYIFLFAKSHNYYFDYEAIKENNIDKYNGKRGTTKTRKKLKSAMRDFSDKETMNKYSTQGRNKRDVWVSQQDVINSIDTMADELRTYGIDEEIVQMAIMNTMSQQKTCWTLPTKPFKGSHFAVFPPDLILPCVLAGCPKGGTFSIRLLVRERLELLVNRPEGNLLASS